MVSDSQQSYSAGDYRKSLWCLDKALELATYSTTIKTSRAECLAFLGRYAEASETANSVLQANWETGIFGIEMLTNQLIFYGVGFRTMGLLQ